ncbi:MAG: preprotein translocase subunit SecA [Acidobacteria bacterium]|nr:preprotein translocase subunit SecA [Acidobacteriota bacterium]
MKLLTKIFGSANERELKRLQPLVDAINALEPQFKALTDDGLRTRFREYQGRVAPLETKEEKEALLEEMLPEVFALVREASWRALRMRHFDVQLMGGIVLHQGKIAEMRTGEGKTLVATLPACLNALAGEGVHIVTVNDYLARRDSEWMGKIFSFLELSVGVIQHDMDDEERMEAYRADITYGTNNEFGFDYLRDNMKFRLEDCVQRKHWYAIVDEVDSILIDEARTPLIISGPSELSTDIYYRVDRVVPKLRRDVDFLVDEKAHTVTLTEDGIAAAERLLKIENLYDPNNIDTLHTINQSLKAHHLFRRDADYVVKDGQVIIVDEFTGRLMPGRRYSDGLHQSLEAKEGVTIERENQTLATITFQNYFRLYEKLAGMTGTAITEAEEFYKIYKLDVMEVPTNRPMIREDHSDMIYRTQREKFKAIVEEIAEMHTAGRPVLVGTVSIEKSEHISKMLKRQGIPHNVLNAKHHEREAEIVAQAGEKGAVTIATNMAGRGTDILLGGNHEHLARQQLKRDKKDWREVPIEEYEAVVEQMRAKVASDHEAVVEAGGLHIIGSERHEARRIDNQLRGRSGRQGDPGSSRFFLSLEDDVMRIHGGDKISGFMQSMGMEEDVPIESKMVTKQIERAQKRVEAHNFQIRKHLLEYDDVMNKQREAIYSMRRELLEGKEQKEYILEVARDLLEYIFDTHAPDENDPEQWDFENLAINLRRQFGMEVKDLSRAAESKSRDEIVDQIWKPLESIYLQKEEFLGEERMRRFEQSMYLQTVDSQWKDHLLALDHLKEGIGLRGYGQKDPLVEYKKESYDLFTELLDRIDEELVRLIWLIDPRLLLEHDEQMEKRRREMGNIQMSRSGPGDTRPSRPKTVVKDRKIGRNEPCPCGSGKKYKHCCGRS